MIKASLLWQVGLIANVKLHFLYLNGIFNDIWIFSFYITKTHILSR